MTGGKYLRTRYTLLIATALLSIFFIYLLPKIIVYIYSPNEVYQRVGLILGTTPSSNGQANIYFQERIRTAADLYKDNLIDCLLVSGDNSRNSYNEPEYMTKALMKYGIPKERIYQDYAGFRTYDSIQRAQEIFGLRSYYLISQKSHLERAYMIALLSGQNPKLALAKAPKIWKAPRMVIREAGSRMLMYLEMLRGGSDYTGGETIKIDTTGYSDKKTCTKRVTQ